MFSRERYNFQVEEQFSSCRIFAESFTSKERRIGGTADRVFHDLEEEEKGKKEQAKKREGKSEFLLARRIQ